MDTKPKEVTDIRDQRIKALTVEVLNERIRRCRSELGRIQANTAFYAVQYPQLEAELHDAEAQLKELTDGSPSN